MVLGEAADGGVLGADRAQRILPFWLQDRTVEEWRPSGRHSGRKVCRVGLQFIDGAFEKLAKRQRSSRLLVSANAGRVWRRRGVAAVGKGLSSLYVVHHNNIKNATCFSGKRNQGEISWWRRDWLSEFTEEPRLLAQPSPAGFSSAYWTERSCGRLVTNLLSESQSILSISSFLSLPAIQTLGAGRVAGLWTGSAQERTNAGAFLCTQARPELVPAMVGERRAQEPPAGSRAAMVRGKELGARLGCGASAAVMAIARFPKASIARARCAGFLPLVVGRVMISSKIRPNSASKQKRWR